MDRFVAPAVIALKLSLAAALLAVVTPASAVAQPGGDRAMPAGGDRDAARGAIEQVIAQEDAAWNKGDAAAFSAHVAPEVVFTNIVGMFSVGRAPFEAQHARIFSTIYKGSTLKQSLVQLTFVREDVAIADTITALSGFHSLPPGSEALNGVLHTRVEQVFVRDDGAWRVASFHNVSINPSVYPGAPPAK